MNLLVLFLAAHPLLQTFQDSDGNETRFHRVHLTNGNFVDGQLIKDTPHLVVLRIRSGEMGIRRDQIDKVEFVKMKDRWQPQTIVDSRPPKGTTPGSTSPTEKTPEVNTPEAIRKKVDMILFRYKQNRKTAEDGLPFEQIQALGEEAVVYLAASAPLFDLQSQDAIMAALIQLKPTPKVVEVLEKLLNHENARSRALALTVLCADASEANKARYAAGRLRDADARVRVTALSALGSTDDRALFEAIGDLCSDADKDVRGRAFRIAKNLSDKHDLKEALGRVMISNLRNSDAGVRTDSASMLGSMGRPEYWKDVVSVLADQETSVRTAAAQALTQLGVPESADEIAMAIGRERDRWPRIQLAAAAIRVKAVKAVEPLISWLSDSEEETRKVAVGALQGITGETYGSDREKWNAWWEKNRPR